MTKHINDYASTPSGIGQYAQDMHKWALTMHDRTTDEGDRMLYTGMARAYDTIVRLVSGRHAGDPIATDVIKGMF